MNIIYPAICHYEDGGYWCEFPRFGWLVFTGDTELEIVENAKEALEGCVISILERGGNLPQARTIKDLNVEGSDFPPTFLATYLVAEGL